MFQASRAGHLLSKAPRRAQANFESGTSYGQVRNQYQEVHVFQNNANANPPWRYTTSGMVIHTYVHIQGI